MKDLNEHNTNPLLLWPKTSYIMQIEQKLLCTQTFNSTYLHEYSTVFQDFYISVLRKQRNTRL